MNANVIEYMCFKQKGAIFILKGKALKLVDLFTYLSSNISSTEKDVNICLTKAWNAIDRLSIQIEIWSIWWDKTVFLPSHDYVHTTVWMHYMDAYKTHKEWDGNCTRKAACCHRQSLKIIPHKTPAVQSPTSYLANHSRGTKHARHWWRNKDKLISNCIFMDSYLWTHQCLTAQQKFTYIISVWILDAGWRTHQEWWMMGMDGNRESRNSMLSGWFDDNNYIYEVPVV